MGIRLRCKDYGYDCEFIVESDDAQQVMKEFGKNYETFLAAAYISINR